MCGGAHTLHRVVSGGFLCRVRRKNPKINWFCLHYSSRPPPSVRPSVVRKSRMYTAARTPTPHSHLAWLHKHQNIVFYRVYLIIIIIVHCYYLYIYIFHTSPRIIIMIFVPNHLPFNGPIEYNIIIIRITIIWWCVRPTAVHARLHNFIYLRASTTSCRRLFRAARAFERLYETSSSYCIILLLQL